MIKEINACLQLKKPWRSEEVELKMNFLSVKFQTY